MKRKKLTLDQIAEQHEVLTPEEMEQFRGGGGEDIIILFDTNAVLGLGHAGVLIGNDTDGWRYLSVNGTGGTFPKIMGSNINPDKGTSLEMGSWQEVVAKYNNKGSHVSHNYDTFVRIECTPTEDAIAFEGAFKQATKLRYNAMSSSCIDVVKSALWYLNRERGSHDRNLGSITIPNSLDDYLINNNYGSYIEM